jgi:hypothetical protein
VQTFGKIAVALIVQFGVTGGAAIPMPDDLDARSIRSSGMPHRQIVDTTIQTIHAQHYDDLAGDDESQDQHEQGVHSQRSRKEKGRSDITLTAPPHRHFTVTATDL